MKAELPSQIANLVASLSGVYRQRPVVIGAIFLLHGPAKFGVIGGGRLQGTIDMFGMMGMPAPGLLAPAVALVELVGGLGLILGFATHIWAILLAAVMAGAIVTVKFPMQPNPIAAAGPMPGYELDRALLVGLLALLFLGSGQAALARTVLPEAYR